MRYVISVESLAVPARAAVLKSLQGRFGMACIPDAERCTSPFALLLHRMRAMARVPDKTHILWCGPWLLATPRDPLMRRLHHDLALALARRLLHDGGAGTKHIMVCLKVSEDEAFETLLEGDGCRDATLQSLREAQAAIEAPEPRSCSPFGSEIVRFDCPCFAADNPVTLAKVVDLACAGCASVMSA